MRHWQPRIHVLFLPLLLLAMLLSACDTSVKTDEAEVGEAITTRVQAPVSEVYKLDTAKTKITWIGARITGRHNGIFDPTQGELLMDNGQLTGGSLELNMPGTRAADKTIGAEDNTKLTKHLLSEDFFDVERYPKATFELTSIAPYDSTRYKSQTPIPATDNELRVKGATHLLTGNLTIKDVTKSIRFPAKIVLQDSLLRVIANFNIDRTHWNLVYRSDKSLGNQTILPQVNIGIDAQAIRTEP